MSNRNRRPRPQDRPTPYRLGEIAAVTTGSLKGLPYGPGKRQEDYITGFYDATQQIARETAEAAANG